MTVALDEKLVDEKLVDEVELVSAVWGGRLDVRPDDPYYFDHPLDHVPGMALLGGLLELARRVGGTGLDRASSRAVLSVGFPSFCELDGAVTLRATAARPVESDVDTALSLLALQGDRDVCTAELTVRRDASPRVAHDDAPPPLLLPADPAAVHRARRENVLITKIADRDGARVVGVLPATAGHALAVRPGAPHRIEHLVDAARQFCTMICHLEHGRPADTRFVMTRISADLPCGLVAGAHLRWSVTPPGRGRLRFTADVVAGGPDGEVCGSVGFEYHAATPAGYRRLRGELRAAA